MNHTCHSLIIIQGVPEMTVLTLNHKFLGQK